MRRPESRSLRYRLALGLGLAMLFAATARAEDKPTCTAATFGTGQVQAVLDGRTVRLSDGRTVRLAGIEVSQPDEADSRANNAKLALEHLVFDRQITLMRLGPETDRYGRVVALVALPSASSGQAVQHAMLAQGTPGLPPTSGISPVPPAC